MANRASRTTSPRGPNGRGGALVRETFPRQESVDDLRHIPVEEFYKDAAKITTCTCDSNNYRPMTARSLTTDSVALLKECALNSVDVMIGNWADERTALDGALIRFMEIVLPSYWKKCSPRRCTRAILRDCTRVLHRAIPIAAPEVPGRHPAWRRTASPALLLPATTRRARSRLLFRHRRRTRPRILRRLAFVLLWYTFQFTA